MGVGLTSLFTGVCGVCEREREREREKYGERHGEMERWSAYLCRPKPKLEIPNSKPQTQTLNPTHTQKDGASCAFLNLNPKP